MPLPRGNAPSLRGVASAERHALHPRGACLAARLCQGERVQGLGRAVWGLGLKVGSCALRAQVLGLKCRVQGSRFEDHGLGTTVKV